MEKALKIKTRATGPWRCPDPPEDWGSFGEIGRDIEHKPLEPTTWSRVGLREQDCDYRSRMIAETYSTVGRSLPLAWLNVWENYGERFRWRLGRGGICNGRIAAATALRSRIELLP